MLPSKVGRRPRLRGLCLLLSLGLAACAQEGRPQPTASITPQRFVTPYWTVAPSQSPVVTDRSIQSVVQPPTPTPTPVTYSVVEGDTMLGIALRFGVSLEDLLAANPEVQPQFLSVGTRLIIPLGENLLPVPATPTPVPVSVGETNCYRVADGSVWCFTLIENDRSKALENLAARSILYSAAGEVVGEIEAIPPLNLIPAGEALPLVAFFAPPQPEEVTAEVQLLAALPVSRTDERYLQVEVEVEETVFEPGGLAASVRGNLTLIGKSLPARQVYLAAVAYGFDDRVVGVRKWEAVFNAPEGGVSTPLPGGTNLSTGMPVPGQATGVPGTPAPSLPGSSGTPGGPPETQLTGAGPALILPGPLEAGTRLPFEILVFSLGPEIHRVEVVAEARP